MDFYEDLDTEKGLICAAKESFRVFNSLLRWGNFKGIPVMEKMYGPQLYSKPLSESSLLSDCQIYANRSTGESNHLRHKGKILEIGVASGSHAVSLIQRLNPSTFHGVDVKVRQVSDQSKAIFTNHGNKGNIVRLYQKDSVQFLEDQLQSNQRYDVIYIDANHWYEFVYKELELSSRLVDVGGHIVFNDYLNWFIGSMEPCGVVKAVNDFLDKNENWKVEYFAINDRDICIRRVV